jgi:hypothetical protein
MPPADPARPRAAAVPLQFLLTDDQLRRLQFRRLHEDFMRSEGFEGWEWPDPIVRVPEADLFEAWLIERWLDHVRSDEYQTSADYYFLRAEWERER